MRVFSALLMPFTGFFLFCCVFFAAHAGHTEEDRLTIYIDADYSVTPAPAEAIEIGLKSAFAGTWAETGIAIVPRDHRTNARRSLDTFQQAWRDPSAIAVVGGMHSPPYFANGARINDGGVPLLLPWSAAGMLTRLAEGDANWIFRLSVDDTKAAAKLVAFGASTGCARPALMFIDNPWGNGNALRISDLLASAGVDVSSRHALPFNAGTETLSEAARLVGKQGADCVYLVTGLVLGKSVIKALADLDIPPRVVSHWGLLGDRLTDHISHEMIDRVRLSILGTCGLDLAHRHPHVYAHARTMARKVSGRAFDPISHAAPHGFFHAYDLGRLLLRAVERARDTGRWHDGPEARRGLIRDALYDLNEPIEGLLRVYVSPFEPVGRDSFDGHEALGRADLCMTTVDDLGHITNLAGE